MQQQPGEGHALLFAQAQHAVPALLLIEAGGEMGEAHQAQGLARFIIAEGLGGGGVAEGCVQRAQRQIGALRHEHHAGGGRGDDLARAPGP